MNSKLFFLKKNICYLPYFNNLMTQRSVDINKKKIFMAENVLDDLGISMVSPKNFKKINPLDYSHCNIWGSGWSASQSSKNEFYTKASFDIGFGFSYLLELNFNFYFIENASEKLSELVFIQKKGLERFLDKENTYIIFKNILQEKNDLEYAIREYSSIALFAKDIFVPHYLNNEGVFRNTTKTLLEYDPYYFRGSCSTIITSIIFARYLGFKNIIIHGVDFGGKYFFDLDEYKKFSNYKPKIDDSIYQKKLRLINSKNPTGNCLKQFIPLFKEYLKLENINLYSSNKDSKLCHFLPLFKKY